MRFGGHETFPIRDGWLHKGLSLLLNEPSKIVGDAAADWLGVGGNMAKSIRHWLLATGLAELDGTRQTRHTPLRGTEMGRLVQEKDPHFEAPVTWWALHVNLVNCPEHAASWDWFFNRCPLVRFDRALGLEGLRRDLQMSGQRMPSQMTLERDLGCLLASYAKKVPAEIVDPEEARDCPFLELGILSYFRNSGNYRLNQGTKAIPPEALGYALSKRFSEDQEGADQVDVTLQRALSEPGGPGRSLALSSETLFELANEAEHTLGQALLSVVGLGGERAIRYRRLSGLDWLRHGYDRESSTADYKFLDPEPLEENA